MDAKLVIINYAAWVSFFLPNEEREFNTNFKVTNAKYRINRAMMHNINSHDTLLW